MKLMWIPQPSRTPDIHAAFRGLFELRSDATVQIRILGASWFGAWLDGEHLLDGPPRFVPGHPEYDWRDVSLKAGKHVLAIQVHDDALATRMMPEMPPFAWAEVRVGDVVGPTTWKCKHLAGYRSQTRRLNPQFGWIEWADLRADAQNWKRLDFDAKDWVDPVASTITLGEMKPRSIGPVQRFDLPLQPVAQGNVAEDFGYELDDPATRFFLRDLECKTLPPQGVWRRYDLSRVRLGQMRLVLDAPAGSVVEIAYAEQLRHGRVGPFITLSAGASCNMDHYITNAGVQTITSLSPRGGRFVEVHVLAPPEKVKFVEEHFDERGYHAEPEGAFLSDDELLNRIGTTGVETYRACAEDAIVDNPTRERGQWLGDALIGGEIAAAAYSDIRLMKRGLMQTAQNARGDGLVPGMTTGGLIFLASYAALFTPACWRYFQMSGDRAFLEQYHDAAEKNLAAFEPHVHPNGLAEGIAWPFIDWGFDRGSSPINIPLNVYYLKSLEAMTRWCEALKHADRVEQHRRRAHQIRDAVKAALDTLVVANDWNAVGYHAAALALGERFFDNAREKACIAYIKQHMLNSFPNKPDGPRNSDPGFVSRQLITPYFAYFAMPPLIERGEMDFVLDQYRKCWGWALEEGRTTWVEVFDTRWSHCHQWSGSPTWQLSRYVLGLNPRYDLGERHFDLQVFAGPLQRAKGVVPINGSTLDVINVEWKRDGDGIAYTLQCPAEIDVHIGETVERIKGEKTLRISPSPIGREQG